MVNELYVFTYISPSAARQRLNQRATIRSVLDRSLGRSAYLTAVEECAKCSAPSRDIEGRGGHHDERVVAGGLDQSALVEASAGLRDAPSGFDAAGERDHVRVGVLDQLLARCAAAAA